MNKQKVAGIIAIIIALIGVIGGGSATNWSFDLSTTNIGQIGDNTINNIIMNEFGVDLDVFKAMCNRGEVHAEFEKYCILIP